MKFTTGVKRAVLKEDKKTVDIVMQPVYMKMLAFC